MRLLLVPLTLFGLGCGSDHGPNDPVEPTLAATAQPTGFSAALSAQTRHTDALLRIDGVVGTAIGTAANGRAVVQVFTREAGGPGLPTILDGVPVSVVVTGQIRATPASPAAAMRVDTKSKLVRPVPIGVSTGNQRTCSAGTIGARVKSGRTVYALSNNHVFALSNSAPIGSNVLQPGRYDLQCSSGADAVIGTLSKFVPISFSTSANNKVDAALAISSTASLGRRTPPDGYGTPSATIAPAVLNQAVQKYGRTTRLTVGTVTGVNATIFVVYPEGTARFVEQVLIAGRGQFSRSGDSGALIVTDDGTRRPVGLLFAGSPSGYDFANPIGAVLQAFRVTIDGT